MIMIFNHLLRFPRHIFCMKRAALARFIQNMLRSTLLHANKLQKNAFNS